MLGMIKKSFFQMDVKTLRVLYTTFVRQLLEFAAPVWSPYLQGDIDMLEKVQRRATRSIPMLSKLSYESRLEKMGITTLKVRRKRGDMIQLFKIFNKIEMVDLMRPPVFNVNSVTRGHDMKYIREICPVTTRQNFITNRSAPLWNSLKEETIISKTTNEFKKNFDKDFKLLTF